MKISNDVFSRIYEAYGKDIEPLFKEESACLIFYRILPELCQLAVMRLINIDDSVMMKRQELKQEWSNIMEPDSARDINYLIRYLYRFKIISDPNIILLNEDFKRNMLKIMKCGISFKPNLTAKKKKKDWIKCFEYGISALENYLYNIMDLDGYYTQEEFVSDKIKLLIDSHLIKREIQNYFKLTPIALQGMLDNRLTQIRLLMITYINKLGAERADNKALLLKFFDFLFLICTLEVGTIYYLDCFEEEFQKHFETFKHFGLLKLQKKKEPKRFYITPLMKCVFEDMGNIFENQENYKFLIVESNFKIYAYTDSKLEKKIVDFIFEIEYIFPGLIVGHITRSSIRKVLKRGVSHQKILQYMSMHAHPQSEYKTVISNISYNVPENVSQQILIWEEEKNAVKYENVIYLFEFDKDDFDRHLDKLKSEGVSILWKSKEKNILIIPRTRKNNEIIKNFNRQMI